MYILLPLKKSPPLAGYEATEWPTEFSPWPSAMGMGIPPTILSPVRTTERINNFELNFANTKTNRSLTTNHTNVHELKTKENVRFGKNLLNYRNLEFVV